MVFSGLVIACRLATCSTSRSPVLVNATTDGVVLPPSSLAMTLGSPPSITATQELLVPRSIPIILGIKLAEDIRGLPESCAISDGRKWKSLPFIFLTYKLMGVAPAPDHEGPKCHASSLR